MYMYFPLKGKYIYSTVLFKYLNNNNMENLVVNSNTDTFGQLFFDKFLCVAF